MKLKEFNNILTTYKELYPDEYQQLYNNIDSEYLDDLFLSLHGNKTVIELIQEKNDINYIAKMIHYQFDKCLKIKNVYDTDYDFAETKTETFEETIKTDGNISNVSTLENTENTFGYNSETAVKDNQTVNNDNSETKQDTTVTKNYKKVNNEVSTNILIDKELNRLKKLDDYYILTFTIYSNILTYNIYE